MNLFNFIRYSKKEKNNKKWHVFTNLRKKLIFYIYLVI
mgnify:CR=1 FL=1